MAINPQGQFAARMGLAAGSSQLALSWVVAHSGTSSWIGAACLFWAVTESSLVGVSCGVSHGLEKVLILIFSF